MDARKERESRPHLSLSKPEPEWLIEIVPTAAQRHWAHRLVVALDLEVDGQGASAGLELSAFALEALGAALSSKRLLDAAKLSSAMAAKARASIAFPLLGKSGELHPHSTTRILDLLNTRVRIDNNKTQGAAIAFGLLLRDAIRGGRHMGRAHVQRVSSMAGACLSVVVDADDLKAWRDLAALQPFDPRALEEFIKGHRDTQQEDLARALRAVQSNVAPFVMPPAAEAEVVVDRPQQRPVPPAPPGGPAEARREPEVASSPSWKALHAAASHAGMAETFNLELAHDRIDVSELSKIGAACCKALRGDATDQLIDSALLQSMAEILNADHGCALDLALAPELDDDTWYCFELRCVMQDRRARRGLSTDAGRREWEAVYVYPEVCDRMEQLLQQTPDAKRLRGLMPHREQAELVQATAAWVKSLTDQAHPATPGRAVHSTCLAYQKAGATDVEISAMTRAPAAASASVGNYYAPSLHRHHRLASAASALLGREQPPPIPQSPLLSPRDVPDDDELRAEWLMLRQLVLSVFGSLETADIAEVAVLFTRGMAACRKAYELLVAARDQVRQHPRWRDAALSADWIFESDKDTEINSDRLQCRTAELNDLVRVALLLRQKARDRLRRLGVPDVDLPPSMVKVTPDTPLFCRLRAIPTARGTRLVVGVLKDEQMSELNQRWRGPQNMGRRYWVGQMAECQRWLEEQALTGHGRGLRHLGSHCLSAPVMKSLQSARQLVRDTLARLALPPFGDSITGTPEPVVVPVDLSCVDRRRDRETRPTDMPQHYTESRTPGFLTVVGRLRPCVGQDRGLSSAARALLALIVAQGLCDSTDVREAWRSLREQWRKKGSVWIDWVRGSGQPIEMPLLAPVRLAADEVEKWPTLPEAEAELRAWLVATNDDHPLQPVLWPVKPGATIAALCWLMSHWVRVHVAALLSLAYRPDFMAATLDRHSLDLLQRRERPHKQLNLRAFRSRLNGVRPDAIDGRSLLWIQTAVGDVATSNERLGERQKRARKVKEALTASVSVRVDEAPVDGSGETTEQRQERWAREATKLEDTLLKSAPRTHLRPVAQMLLIYLDLEVALTRARDKDAISPGTYYDYLSAVRAQLEQHWPAHAEPTQILGRTWRKITRRVLKRLAGESDTTHAARCKAWRRILNVLVSHPAYEAASSALDESGAPSKRAKYIPSAASALWPRRLLPAIQMGIAEHLRGEPLAPVQARALCSLLLEAGPRRSEACGVRARDLSKDGTWYQRFPSGHDNKKTRLAVGRSRLGSPLDARMRELRALVRGLHPTPAYLFGESASDDSLTYPQTLVDLIVDVARDKIGSELVVAHGARGSAAMHLLVPGWEARIEALAEGPFKLADALAIVAALEGIGPDHLAHMLCSIGHASHRTFVRRYFTCWPLLYAACMRASLSDIELKPELIRKMPHLKDDKERARALLRRRSAKCAVPKGTPSDDWEWAISHHYPPRKPGPKPRPLRVTRLDQEVPPGAGGADAVRPVDMPAFGLLLDYQVRRHLGFVTVQAAKDATLGIEVARWLDQSACGAPAPSSHEPDESASAKPTNARTFLLNQINSPHGRGLIAALAAASPLWKELAGLLQDSANAPPVTRELIVALRDLLPPALSVHVAISEERCPAPLAQSLDGLVRVRMDFSPNVERARPRVRVMPTQLDKHGDVMHGHAAVLTHFASVALAICPVLVQLVENHDQRTT
jgi:integrase